MKCAHATSFQVDPGHDTSVYPYLKPPGQWTKGLCSHFWYDIGHCGFWEPWGFGGKFFIPKRPCPCFHDLEKRCLPVGT